MIFPEVFGFLKNKSKVKVYSADEVDDKLSKVKVPTKTSELTNDSNFVKTDDIDNKTEYTDFVIETHSMTVSGLSANNSKEDDTTITKEGYYPLSIASVSYNHNQAGFTFTPQRITSRGNGTGTLKFYARNEANGATGNCTAYCDVLWVKIRE